MDSRAGPEQMPGVAAEQEQGVIGAPEQRPDPSAVFQPLEPRDALEQVAGEEEGDERERGRSRKRAMRRSAGRAPSSRANSR